MGLDAADGKGEIHDFYTIGLWNYCYGDYKNGDYKVTHCTDRQQKFWFNPAEAWGFDDTIEELYPKSLQKGLDSYEKVAGWMFIAYAVAIASNVVQLVVGISAIFSRWGSFVTTIIAMVCTSNYSPFIFDFQSLTFVYQVSVVFTVAASATSSALFGILVGALKTGLKPFDIHADMGSRMFAATWLASAFSVAGGLFWLFSVCCCSGRSPFSHDDRKGRRGIVAEKAPYTYERVASPYQAHPGAPAGSSVPMHNMPPQDSAYEPYRHEQRV